MTRDDKGRFARGQSGNPAGRPPKATEAEYIEKVSDVIPLERFGRMLEAQAKRAERGDIRAFEALAKYLAPVIEKREQHNTGGMEIRVTYVKADNTDAA